MALQPYNPNGQTKTSGLQPYKDPGAGSPPTSSGGFFASAPTGTSPYQTGSFFTSPLVGYQPQESKTKGILGTLANLPSSAIRFGKGLFDMATGKTPGGLMPFTQQLAGGVQEIPGVSSWFDKHVTSEKGKKLLAENRQAFDEGLKRQYGSVENIKRSIQEDPVGTLLVARSFLEGGSALADKAGLPDVSARLGRAADLTSPTKVAGAVSSVVKPPIQDILISRAIGDWEKPGTQTKPGFSGARTVLEDANKGGNNIPDKLVKSGILPSDHVDEGRYNTKPTADQIRADNAKASSDMLRPALELADPTVQRVPVDTVLEKTIADIEKTRNITELDRESQIAKAKAQAEALRNKYQNGMSLTDMHDSGIAYNSQGGFSPVKDPAVNNNASVNRAFGRQFSGLVKENAPAEIGVADFQKELQKGYQAADYLDELHGKKVPVSLLSRSIGWAAKGAGAAVGGFLGGGIFGEFAGYNVGGMLKTMLEGMSDSVRGTFLDNLKKENPQAFDAVSQYMKDTQEQRAGQLALPPGEKTIPLSSQTEGSKASSGTRSFSENRQNLNPITGVPAEPAAPPTTQAPTAPVVPPVVESPVAAASAETLKAPPKPRQIIPSEEPQLNQGKTISPTGDQTGSTDIPIKKGAAAKVPGAVSLPQMTFAQFESQYYEDLSGPKRTELQQKVLDAREEMNNSGKSGRNASLREIYDWIFKK
jgi:hypothetical protein